MSSQVTIGGLDNKSDNELNKYLEQRIDIESIDDNPLKFWYKHRFAYPIFYFGVYVQFMPFQLLQLMSNVNLVQAE
jgi:hypothetical protein